MRIFWRGTAHPVALVGHGIIEPDVETEVRDELAQKLIDEGRADAAETETANKLDDIQVTVSAENNDVTAASSEA